MCADLTNFVCFLILGTKQTGALKQQDASKRYENYLDNCIHLAVCLILIEPFLKTIMGATLEKFITRRGRSESTINSHIDSYIPLLHALRKSNQTFLGCWWRCMSICRKVYMGIDVPELTKYSFSTSLYTPFFALCVRDSKKPCLSLVYIMSKFSTRSCPVLIVSWLLKRQDLSSVTKCF